MKHEVLRIEPRSAMRIGFFVGLLGGFIFGLFETLIFRAMSSTGGSTILPPEARQLLESGSSALLLVAVITGLGSSLIVALFGGLTAIFYNMGSRLFGGLEVVLNEPPAEAAESVAQNEDEHDV